MEAYISQCVDFGYSAWHMLGTLQFQVLTCSPQETGLHQGRLHGWGGTARHSTRRQRMLDALTQCTRMRDMRNAEVSCIVGLGSRAPCRWSSTSEGSHTTRRSLATKQATCANIPVAPVPQPLEPCQSLCCPEALALSHCRQHATAHHCCEHDNIVSALHSLLQFSEQ
jgi:hypothetical protein